jgi:hypothetical protein
MTNPAKILDSELIALAEIELDVDPIDILVERETSLVHADLVQAGLLVEPLAA